METERDFVDVTREFWEPIAGEVVSRDGAREIIENVVTLFVLLAECRGKNLIERIRREKCL